MDETNTLCEAVVAWVSAVLPRLGPDQFQIIEAMLAGRCDVAVEARLLKGTVTLVAIGGSWAYGAVPRRCRTTAARLRNASRKEREPVMAQCQRLRRLNGEARCQRQVLPQ